MYLVCGKALFDLFSRETGALPGELSYTAVAGGSPFNVAVGLRRLGVDSALLAGLSADYLGARLRRVLETEQVGTDYLVEFDAPTTLAMVGVGPQGSPEYQFRGDGCADRLLRPEHLPSPATPFQAIHVGSYSLVVQPVGDTLLELVRRAGERSLISFDPNIRLNVESDIALWRERVDTFARLAHLIKVSDEDLRLLYPERDPREVARQWLGERCQLVFLTRGGSGAEAYHARLGHRSVPTRPVQVRDTVGAGDTFIAALLAYLARNRVDRPEALARLSAEQLDAMLHFAVRAAALTCSRVGPDMPRWSDLEPC